jgi:FtsZ-binding cell division protein ZapB
MPPTIVCPATPLPFDPSKGISTTSLYPDSTTGRVPAAQIESYLASIRSQGLLPSPPSYTSPPGDLATQINKDASSFTMIQAEYCYYEAEYKTALSKYLADATSTDTSLNESAKTELAGVTQLNLRLNSLLEIMNSLSQERANNVESNKDSINKMNKDISAKLSGLQEQYNRITKDDRAILRQTRMVEYSKEKNNAISNQIGLYIALNIAAISMIFFVSRSL